MLDSVQAGGAGAALAPAGAPGRGAAAGPGGHVVRTRSAADLRRIAEPGINLAVFDRALPAGVVRALAPAAPALAAFALDAAMRVRAVRADLAGAPGLSRAERRMLAPLFGDVAALAQAFAALTGADRLRVRLEAVAGDGCKYFHVDHVGIRLLCTYRGAGTQWLPNYAVVRAALGSGRNAAIAPWPGLVQSLAAGQIALMKGEAWPGNAGRGLVHRSPPADRRAGPRLVLCIDDDGG